MALEENRIEEILILSMIDGLAVTRSAMLLLLQGREGKPGKIVFRILNIHFGRYMRTENTQKNIVWMEDEVLRQVIQK